MTCVITGGAGFIGLNIVEAGLKRGEEVALVTNGPVPANALAAFEKLPGRLHVYHADARDGNAVREIITAHRADLLFPFAAISPSVATESASPEVVIEVNLLGLVAQLRAARDAAVRRVLVPASGAVYGHSAYDHQLLHEAETACRPSSVYGMTKYAVETTSLRLGELWSLDVVVARIGGAFGPWEHQSGARETFGPHFRMLMQVRAGRDIVLPEVVPSTSSIYSRDLADALWYLAELHNPAHRVFNTCTGLDWADKLPLWADMLCSLFPDRRWRRASAGDPGNIELFDSRDRGRLDIKRLTDAGWVPNYLGLDAYMNYANWISEYDF